MTPLSRLYHIADQEHIEVDCFDLGKREALSLMDESGSCFIAIDPFQLLSTQDETLKLAHELGHCVTGSFYNIHASLDCRQKHENTADKWAVQQLIPSDALDQAVAEGYTEIWELAEHFDVTEEFMRKAVCLHVHGNVAVELYF